MPAIWNVNSSYNVNNNSNKKVASKLTFNVGEKFSGKIMKKGDGNEVSIKLTDGWEFSAELDCDLDSLEKGFHRFEVDGFKDGKLKLKLINKEGIADQSSKGELNNIVSKEGLSKKDIHLLESMLKYNIPLSTENIKTVKGLVQFNEKIQCNPKEIETFISKYLESKGIDPNTLKGQEVTKKLEQFFNAFKNLSKEEVLLFLENDIAFTKENIESYNKLFKGNGKVLDVINQIKNQLEGKEVLDNNVQTAGSEKNDIMQNKVSVVSVLKSLIGENENALNSEIKALVNSITNENIDKLDSTINKVDNTIKIKNDSGKLDNSNNKAQTATYEKNDIIQNKVSVVSVLKSLIGENESAMNSEIKALVNSITDESIDKLGSTINKVNNTLNMKSDSGKLENLNNKLQAVGYDENDIMQNKVSVVSVLKSLIGEGGNSLNSEIKDLVNKINDDSTNKIDNTINVENDIMQNKVSVVSVLKSLIGESENSLNSEIKALVNSVNGDGTNKVYNTINMKSESGKLDNSNNKVQTATYEKNDIIQNKVSVLAVLKSLMGEGENTLNVELKDLINSRRDEFTTKEFDKAYNTINKMDSESFISMLKDEVSEYDSNSKDTFSDYVSKRIDEAKAGVGGLPFNKVELENVLSKLIGKNIVLTEDEFSKIKDIINLKTTSESKPSEGKDLLNNKPIITEAQGDSKVDKTTVDFKNDNTEILKGLIKDKISSQEIVKNTISGKGEEGKEIIKNILSSLKNEALPERILDVIKNNISDIKLFNKISQEYYYIDVPINIKEQEYPCKLILKDNRKGGKKIDSTNVKMVVTVKTSNLGTIDGYIKVVENKIDIDLKCEKIFVKILDLGKEKLVSNIKSLGFNISVNVSKKEDEVSLTNCRDFFNENNMANIDIKV